MTLLTIQHVAGLVQQEFALNSSTKGKTQDGLSQHYIKECTEHIIAHLRQSFGANTNVTFKGAFPDYPSVDTTPAEFEAEFKIPIVVISTRLGPMSEIGVGRLFSDTVDGPAYAFNQTVFIEFDVHATDMAKADQIGGFITFLFQRDKIELQRKGFKDINIIYSRPTHGFDFRLAWDFREYFYTTKVRRHLVYMKLDFEVVWIDKLATEGVISQVVFTFTNDFTEQMILGTSFAYLLAEEQFYGLHNIAPNLL